MKAHQHLFNRNGYLGTALHARIPREGTIGILQFLQLLNSHRHAIVQAVLVEEVSQALFLFALTVGCIYPRCLIQHEIFQLLVLLQLRSKRSLITLELPLFEDRLHLRILIQQRLAQQITVIRGCLVNGTMLTGLSQNRQRLHHEPSRIVGIFDGEFLLGSTCREQLGQINSLHSWFVLGIRHRLGDILTIGQNGQIVLFTITKTIATGYNFTNKQ